ncbi:collagen alpha-1(I) chain-like [Corvus cornix cornix]|uniref:collagen alpha-1(I) chain-like n=1 Tax=Corvus cornix cornix TaxID=932674 RepID=UPI0019508DBC|nr:collagen alpha-1(I) chain-like [Corvus cornix cornix]
MSVPHSYRASAPTRLQQTGMSTPETPPLQEEGKKRIPFISALPWNAARTEQLQRTRQLPSVAPRGTCQHRLFSSTPILRLQPLFSLQTNLEVFHSNTRALSKIRPSLSPPREGQVQRTPSATRLSPVGFYFPSVFSWLLFLRPGIDVPGLCEGKAVPGGGGAGAYANARGRNPRLPQGWAGERGRHRPHGGSARGGERGAPAAVPPPPLPGSRGGGGTGKPRGAPRERHLKGRTTAGGGRSGEAGGKHRSPKPGGGTGRQANEQTQKRRHKHTGSGGGRRARAGAERGAAAVGSAPAEEAPGRPRQPTPRARDAVTRYFKNKDVSPHCPARAPPGITSSHKAPRAQEASEGGGHGDPGPGPRAGPWPRPPGDGRWQPMGSARGDIMRYF